MIELFEFLRSSGFETYFIGQKKGSCTRKYIVIRDAGTIPIYSNKAGTQIIDIIGYAHTGESGIDEQFAPTGSEEVFFYIYCTHQFQ